MAVSRFFNHRHLSMIFVVGPRLLRKNFDGISLWPFVIARHSSLRGNSVFVNHERIHLRQQAEMLVVFFYLWYGIEFLLRWYSCGNKTKAYLKIGFEREAYAFENDMQYLNRRKIWNFLRFL